MFRMACETRPLLLDSRDMALANLRHRRVGEPLFGMTTRAFRWAWPVKRNMALRARGNHHVSTAEVSRRPHGLRIRERAPGDPRHKKHRDSRDDLHRRFWERTVTHCLQPSEEQRSDHMQDDQHHERYRERSVDGSPPSEYFFLGC